MSATALREKLDDLIIELDRLDITLDSPVSDMTVGEYEQEREKLLDEFIQAITATLGGGECAMIPSFTTPRTLDDCQEFCCSVCGEYMVIQQFPGCEEDVPSYCPNCGRKVMVES